MSTTRQVTYDKKKRNKNQRKFDKVTRKPSEDINYQMIKSQNVQKTASECFDFLKNSKMDADQYSSIINNIQSLNISENEHKFNFNSTVLETLKELITYEYEEDSDDTEQGKHLHLIYLLVFFQCI